MTIPAVFPEAPQTPKPKVRLCAPLWMTLLGNDPVRTVGDVGDCGKPLAVLLVEFSLAPERSARHLRLAEFEAIMRVNRDEVWCTGYRIPDGFDIGFQYVRDNKPPLATLEVPFELDVCEDWF